MNSNRYAIFPFGQVEYGSKVVIYGAGRAGQNFFRQVENTHYCTVLYFVDKNYENIPVHGIEVKPVEALLGTPEYDYCIISPLDPVVRASVYDALLTLGMPNSKIILPQDNEFDWSWYGFANAETEFEYGLTLENYFRQCDARKFVSSNRIDIAVRYLLFKDFINEISNQEHLSLFSRYTMARTGGKEGVFFHSDGGKSGIKEFIEKGKALCESISEKGFLKEHFVPMNESGEALDGLHRIAAAIVTGDTVWAREYQNSEQLYVNSTFFNQEGFNTADKIRVLRAFSDIYSGECSIAVLFSPVSEHWEFIERQIAKHSTVVGRVDLDFNGNYIAFENILHEMYEDAAFLDYRIDRKLNVLKMSPLLMRVLLLSNEGVGEDEISFHQRLKSIKFAIRDSLIFDVDEVPIHLHISDNRKEYIHLKHLLLSVNTLNCMRRKFVQRYTQQFIDMLDEFKLWCGEHNIPITDTCIVGSASMNVFGIKEAEDVDFTLLSQYRTQLNGDGPYKISDNLEIVRQNYVRSIDGDVITDKALIGDDNLYFWFYGCKFLNLDLLYKKKQFNNRPKDIEDLRKLDLFMDLELAYDGKSALRKQIEDEMFRRRLCF